MSGRILAVQLRRMAANKALEIGEAWNALEAAADRIEALEAMQNTGRMKTVKRKVRLVIDAYPLFSEYGEPVVSAWKMALGGSVPTLPDDAVRSVVEVELTVPVMIEEEELPPAVAIEIARDERRDNAPKG